MNVVGKLYGSVDRVRQRETDRERFVIDSVDLE